VVCYLVYCCILITPVSTTHDTFRHPRRCSNVCHTPGKQTQQLSLTCIMNLKKSQLFIRFLPILLDNLKSVECRKYYFSLKYSFCYLGPPQGTPSPPAMPLDIGHIFLFNSVAKIAIIWTSRWIYSSPLISNNQQ
jgi:hypothetical protein